MKPFLADKQRGDGYSAQTVKQVQATFRLWIELVPEAPYPASGHSVPARRARAVLRARLETRVACSPRSAVERRSSRLLEDTTNSYWHLFFEALLAEFQDGSLGGRVFSLDALAIGVPAAAWHPARVCRLSLGLRDKTAETLETIELGEDGPLPARR